jgi:hypothetical protein
MRSLANAIVIGTTTLSGLAGCSGGLSDETTASTTSETLRTSSPDAAGPACGTRFVAVDGDTSSSDDCRVSSDPCATFKQAIAAACAGDTVLVGPGTFAENVVVDKPVTVLGSGDATIVVPATSAPNPCSDSSLCGGAASSVVLVRAANVTLGRFAIDGDNPGLTSGVVAGGADLDARNGIITDANGALDGLTVRDVTVKDVYLRGIEASSGGSFIIERSRVSNLSADPEAIGIFNSGGAGTIADDVVTAAPAGIASNFSLGTAVVRNRVSASGAGIHTDNAGALAGSSPDVIADNEVTSCTEQGFGVFVFAASLGVDVRANRVSRCAVGMADFGQGAAVQTRFVGNRIDGRGLADSTGLYVTTSLLGFGSSDVDVLVARNAIDNVTVGVLLEQETGFKVTADVRCNSLAGDSHGIVTQSPTATVEHNAIAGGDLALDASALTSPFDAPHNWWGCAGGPAAAGCGTVSGNVGAAPVAATPPLCTLFL